MTFTIPQEDRLDATGPTELLLTEVPPDLHLQQDWVHIRGVELDGGFVTDGPVRLVVRAALLRELAERAATARADEAANP
jgi:hypothetical protein